MRKRLLKYLRRFLIVLLVIGVLGLIAFSWICYWPLEGEVENLDQLIPETADFVIRGNYDEIKETGWFQQNVLENPAHGALADFVKGTGDPRASSWPKLQAELKALNRQINDQIPLGIVDFDVERDVLSGDVVVAGVWCAGARPPQPPGWQELLLLKRLTWKPRAGLAAAIGHGFIRDMALPQPGPKMETHDEDHEIVKITLPGIPVRSAIERGGCGRGFVMPPDNEWYIMRVKDVVAVSNSPKMMLDVVDLIDKSANHGEGFRGREWFDITPDEAKVTAAFDIQPMHEYVVRTLETLGTRQNLINHYVKPVTFERLNGSLSLKSKDHLVGEASIYLRKSDLSDELKSLYRLPHAPLREGLAEFAPAESTWLTATIRARPMHFFSSILDMLTPAERRLLRDNVRLAKDEQGVPYKEPEDVFKELTPRLGDTAWIAVGRLDEVFDKVEYSEYFTDEDDPYPGFAFMMRIREGATLTEVDEFLRDKAKIMGMDPDKFDRKEHAGIPYTRLSMIETTRDFKHVTPCYYLAQDRFIFCNNEVYFREILETIADPTKSLARSDKFQVAMSKVEERSHLGLYVDMKMLCAAPASDGTGARGHLWDLRNKIVTDPLAERERSIDHRKNLMASFQRRRGRHPNDQEMVRIDDQVDAYIEAWRESYPQLIEDYRKELRQLSRLKSVALSLGATDGELLARLVIGLRSPGDE